jgi:hypothetical protein
MPPPPPLKILRSRKRNSQALRTRLQASYIAARVQVVMQMMMSQCMMSYKET